MNLNLKNILIAESASIGDVMRVLNNEASQIVLIVDEKNRLIGTVTDGDIRRGLLNGIPIDSSISAVTNHSPITIIEGSSERDIFHLMQVRGIQHLPVLNKLNEVVGLKIFNEIFKLTKKNNLVVLMAGGMGTRLGDITKQCPKPLLKVGSRPIMETILSSFIQQGYWRFALSVNYKSHMIEEYFGNGSKWGVEIFYLRETQRLGTAGALSLIEHRPEAPIFIMNGDLLTNVDFNAMLQFHFDKKASATMGVKEYDIQIPYGVIEAENGIIETIEEKPLHRFLVNAGMYIVEPDLIDLVPKNQFFDMPDLFRKIQNAGKITSSFAVHEYWLDIGQTDELEKAQVDFKKIF